LILITNSIQISEPAMQPLCLNAAGNSYGTFEYHRHHGRIIHSQLLTFTHSRCSHFTPLKGVLPLPNKSWTLPCLWWESCPSLTTAGHCLIPQKEPNWESNFLIEDGLHFSAGGNQFVFQQLQKVIEQELPSIV
jgi:hypothetical protein